MQRYAQAQITLSLLRVLPVWWPNIYLQLGKSLSFVKWPRTTKLSIDNTDVFSVILLKPKLKGKPFTEWLKRTRNKTQVTIQVTMVFACQIQARGLMHRHPSFWLA